jgi:hypothetical protein
MKEPMHSPETIALLRRTVTAPDRVNHPGHYRANGLEAINVIEAFGLDFCLGNAIKYILRAGRKPYAAEIEDLEKAVWYINRRIEKLRNNGGMEPGTPEVKK